MKAERGQGISLAIFKAVAIFLLVGTLGSVFQWQIEELSCRLLDVFSLKLLLDAGEVYAVWAGILSVHAAVGAISPVLGYTLFATTVTSASRIAPAGAVIARKIGWDAYFRRSVALLVGSLCGFVLLPNLLGVIAAGLAATYVSIATVRVFLEGFQLLEHPEKFDVAARDYLKSSIPAFSSRRAGPLDQSLEDFNRGYANLAEFDYRESRSSFPLVLGDKFRTTQLLRIDVRAYAKLASEVGKYGYELRRTGASVPCLLPRGTHPLFRVVSVQRARGANDQEVLTEREIPSGHRDQIQSLLTNLLLYGQGERTDELVRLPMIANRHVASVLYESMPSQQPHNFPYGLDVLAEVMDHATNSDSFRDLDELDVLDWMHEIPAFLIEQISVTNVGRSAYVRHLSSFLRRRIVDWIKSEKMRGLAQAYLRYLIALLGNLLRDKDPAASQVALVYREIPALVDANDGKSLAIILREMIVLYVSREIAEPSFIEQRRLVLNTIKRSILYSYRGDEDRALVEVVVGLLGLALYRADSEAIYAGHPAEASSILLEDMASRNGVSASALEIIENVGEIGEAWRWDHWELDQKGEGAHWVSITTWLRRAAVVVLSEEAWLLLHTDADRLPSLQVLEAIKKDVATAESWAFHLGEGPRARVMRMSTVVDEAIRKREGYVSQRVEQAPLSFDRMNDYVRGVWDELQRSFFYYNDWLMKAGAVDCDDVVDSTSQAGVGNLVPREWFVDGSVLDIPIHVVAPSVGHALIDYELSRIERIRGKGTRKTLVADFLDQRIWVASEAVLARPRAALLLIGVGVGEYDIYDQLERLRSIASESGVLFKFETTRLAGDKSLLVIDASRDILISRRLPEIDGISLAEKRSEPARGGVVVRVAEIDDQMSARWTADMKDEERQVTMGRYKESLLFQVAWSAKVHARPEATIRRFVLRPRSKRKVGEEQ